MRPIRIACNAAVDSQWVATEYLSAPFSLGLGFEPSSDAATVSGTVQHTFDDLDFNTASRVVTIARAAGVATVTDTGPDGIGHGLVTGDCIIVQGGGAPFDTAKVSATLIGQHGDLGADITVTGANTYTYVVPNSGPTVDNGSTRVVSLRVFNHASIAAQATRTDGYYAFPVTAIRLKMNTLTAGQVTLSILQGNAR